MNQSKYADAIHIYKDFIIDASKTNPATIPVANLPSKFKQEEEKDKDKDKGKDKDRTV